MQHHQPNAAVVLSNIHAFKQILLKNPISKFHIKTRVANPHHFNADPDPDPSFRFNAEPDPVFHSKANPDPASKK